MGGRSKIVSLFSGCGGFDLGFLGGFNFGRRHYEKLPFEVVWANDLNPAACATYRYNVNNDILCGSVWEMMETLPECVDIVIGGFPCQDVSINGIRQAENGSRTNLYKAMVQVIERLQPRVFVAENVKGLLMSHSKDLYSQMIGDFEQINGYRVSHRLHQAAGYGVPQMRERVFIVGVKGVNEFKHCEGPRRDSSSWMTAQAALWDLEDDPEEPSINHIWSKAAPSKEQGNRRLRADSPSTTIRAEHHGNVQFHYKNNRRISLREAARLQSFPDNFIFQSRMRETERQIGNAVPPVMAWHLASALQEYVS